MFDIFMLASWCLIGALSGFISAWLLFVWPR